MASWSRDVADATDGRRRADAGEEESGLARMLGRICFFPAHSVALYSTSVVFSLGLGNKSSTVGRVVDEMLFYTYTKSIHHLLER